MTLISLYKGDKVALATAGAKPITKRDNAYVYNMVENLAITAGLPMPKVYVMQDPAINAFATGRDPKHASDAVTTGAIDALENEELEALSILHSGRSSAESRRISAASARAEGKAAATTALISGGTSLLTSGIKYQKTGNILGIQS